MPESEESDDDDEAGIIQLVLSNTYLSGSPDNLHAPRDHLQALHMSYFTEDEVPGMCCS